MAVHHVHDEAEYNSLKSGAGDKLVIVDFSANWCGPCKRIAPVFEELAKQHANAVFLHVDVDELQGLPDGSDVSSIPCFKFFKGGNLVEHFVGGNADKLKELVQKHA